MLIFIIMYYKSITKCTLNVNYLFIIVWQKYGTIIVQSKNKVEHFEY